MNSQELRALQEAYSQVYELDENRMASRMGKMPSAPAKVGKATHSIKDIAPSKEPSSKEKAKARKALGLDEASVTDDRVRRNQKAFGSNYTPPRDWDQSANRGKGAVVNAKQKEKQRRKGLAKSAMGEAVDLYDIILSHLLDEGYADTEQAAEAIMVNMSEDWRESIIEAVDPDYTGPSQDPLSRANRAIGNAVKFATGQQAAEVRAKQKGVPGNVVVKQSGPFSTKNVPTKGSFISDTEMKKRGQSTKPMGYPGQ